MKNMSSNNEKRQRDANLKKKVGIPLQALFEVIKVQGRQLQNINYHNDRLNRSRFNIFGIKEHIHLEDHIKIPLEIDNQTYKCRVIYSIKIEKIEFELYQFQVEF